MVKIRRWGVSNLDTKEMQELIKLPNGDHCATNQVLYHLGSRGIEVDLLPWQQEQGMPVMAYSPLAQAGSLRSELTTDATVQQIAEQHGVHPFQVLLSWCIRDGNVLAIPKASSRSHVESNAQAKELMLSKDEINQLNQAFPAPDHKVSLDII